MLVCFNSFGLMSSTTSAFFLWLAIIEEVWSLDALVFILPGSHSLPGAECARFSNFFCLSHLWSPSRRTERPQLWTDTMRLQILAYPMHLQYNWFSYNSGQNTCCYDQIGSYMRHGQPNGYSPDLYVSRLSDFRSDGKGLEFVKVRYNSRLCLNVIYELSFGNTRAEGDFMVRGGEDHADFIFPPNPSGYYQIFQYDNLRRDITFDWFKFHIVCPEKPWICMVYGPGYSMY
ncbi:uncharacterized protein LOC142351253 [Convolutriloba macropyga]|uniref:uncharacterized protein LOC142351253 n=1 Tax=Convolutriloba macropyga TaxID=536237 RepID=UPI003F5235D0